MSILMRVLSWVGGMVSGIVGMLFARKMMQKATEQQLAAQGAATAEAAKQDDQDKKA